MYRVFFLALFPSDALLRNGRSGTMERVPFEAGTERNEFHLKQSGTERNDLFLALVPILIKERDGTSSILNHLELERN